MPVLPHSIDLPRGLRGRSRTDALIRSIFRACGWRASLVVQDDDDEDLGTGLPIDNEEAPGIPDDPLLSGCAKSHKGDA